MTRFEINTLHHSSAWSLYRMRERIDMDPEYQRLGEIWNMEKRQLLIDTMINGFDVPKLYLHKFPVPVKKGSRTVDYAMIDGKQRAEAVFQFIENRYPLDDNFRYLADREVDLKRLTYRELATKYPIVKQDFDAFILNVMTVETDDIVLIEDLFSRLNEAMPLNAAEKRNAKPGPLPKLVREIARHPLFTDSIPFDNSRYRHYDIAAKMLLLASRDRVVDTKKIYLDRFFQRYAGSTSKEVLPFKETVTKVLDRMAQNFTSSDPLLSSGGMISLYFLVFRRAMKLGKENLLSRATFKRFEESRLDNRCLAAEDGSQANYHLIEFDRLSQSPNDGVALRFRLGVLDEQLYERRLGFADGGVIDKDEHAP